ncbi:MAG TPA: CT253 family lipoprotein [Chlamydiales bacterium]|nr:CT253 family lipoprotein [Chlamydiales bacterium]
MRYFLLFAFSLFLVSCSHRTDYMTRFHEDGRAKPVAAIASMIDTSSFELPWSISEELTSMISSQIRQGGKIFVVAKEDDAFSENPFGADLSWVKREFSDQEFAVFLELVEHEIVPAAKSKNDLPQEISSHLNMAVRLRVVDNRGATPKIVLQEIVKDTYFIPKSVSEETHSITWGNPAFAKTPMGIAHAQLTRELTSRISDYILLAKSR